MTKNPNRESQISTRIFRPWSTSLLRISNLPDRVSLISFNDTSLTKQVYPPLSSITVYTEEMGRAGMDILNKEVLHGRKIPSLTMLGTRLTLRESTLP